MARRRLRVEWPIRVYRYGVHLPDNPSPSTWPEALKAVVLAQRDLWQRCLHAWEHNETQYTVLMEHATHLNPLREALATARETVKHLEGEQKQRRQEARSKRYAGAQQDTDALRDARVRLRETRHALRTAAAAYRQQIAPQLTTLIDELQQTIHTLGNDSPLAWYNERLVTESFLRTVSRFFKRMGGPPRPRHRLDRAHLTYHFTGPPLTWEQLLGGKTSMITFEPVPQWAWDPTQSQALRRRAARTMGHLRISDTDTLDFRVTLQRRPPEGALIKGVDLIGRETLRPFGDYPSRWSWELQLVCELPPELVPARLGTRHAAIDLGWRIREEGIRLGMLFDGTAYRELLYPHTLLERWRFAQGLHGKITRLLHACKADLERVWDTEPLPPDLDPRGVGWAHAGQGAMSRLLHAVRLLPMSVPSRVPTLVYLERWAAQTGKIWREARGLTNRLARAREHAYNVLCVEICQHYDTIALEDINLQHLATRDTAQTPRLQNSQQYRHLLAPGQFRQRLIHTAQREGVTIKWVDAQLTTRTCPLCGEILTRQQHEEQEGALHLVCPQGHPYEQDRGAAKELFRRAFLEA